MRYKKLICGLLCATVLMAVPVSVVPVYANEQIQDLQDQIDALEKKKQEAQNSLAGIQDDKEKEIANRNAIVTEIDSTVQQITLLQEQIDIIASDMESKNQAIEGKNEEIADKEDEIQDKMDDIDENYELLKQRLRASYMSNGATTLDLIMGAKSFGEFLSQSEMTRKIAEHDQAILEQLRADQKVLEEDLQDLEQSKADLEAAKADLEVSKSSLEETQSAVNSKRANWTSYIRPVPIRLPSFPVWKLNLKRILPHISRKLPIWSRRSSVFTPRCRHLLPSLWAVSLAGPWWDLARFLRIMAGVLMGRTSIPVSILPVAGSMEHPSMQPTAVP